MPIKARLRGPSGEVEMLLDPENALHRVLPAEDDSSFSLLNTIDWYDITEFHSRDMPEFLKELKRVTERATRPADRAYLADLRRLAEECASRPDCILRFVGD